MRKILAICALFVLTACGVFGQGTTSTARRIIRGDVLPATCSVSDVFYKTSAPGNAMYVCTATNVWSNMTNISAVTAPDVLIDQQTTTGTDITLTTDTDGWGFSVGSHTSIGSVTLRLKRVGVIDPHDSAWIYIFKSPPDGATYYAYSYRIRPSEIPTAYTELNFAVPYQSPPIVPNTTYYIAIDISSAPTAKGKLTVDGTAVNGPVMSGVWGALVTGSGPRAYMKVYENAGSADAIVSAKGEGTGTAFTASSGSSAAALSGESTSATGVYGHSITGSGAGFYSIYGWGSFSTSEHGAAMGATAYSDHFAGYFGKIGLSGANVEPLVWLETANAANGSDFIRGSTIAGSVTQQFAIQGDGTYTGKLQIKPDTKPACDSTNRFRVWAVAGAAGVADTFEVCSKDVADVYTWRTLQ